MFDKTGNVSPFSHGRTLHEMIAELNASIGAASVAALAGAKDSKSSYRWARPDGASPNDAAARRLMFAHRQWTILSEAYGPQAARLWFISAEPSLGYDTPIAVIRGERFKAVAAAAEAWVADAGL